MRVIGKALYGSQLYHLDGPQSDKDYKIFIAPEFIDLYNMKDKYGLPVGYNTEHDSTLDFRKFDSSLRKSNINIIELIFSPDLNIYDKSFIPYFEIARKAYKEGYIAYVWNYFFASAKGRTLNSLKRYNYSEEVRRKSASRAMWTINFLAYLIGNDYKLTQDIYDKSEIYEYPREIRYGESAFVPRSEEEWLERFDALEMLVKNNPCEKGNFYFKEYENRLMLCAQNIIAEVIKKELENK